jgi:hypothetical protein
VREHELPLAAVVLAELAVLVDHVDQHHIRGRVPRVPPVVIVSMTAPMIPIAVDFAVRRVAVLEVPVDMRHRKIFLISKNK